ncbi:hypothetical protein GS429_04095 [Natronorubrum sp. JWXQ-INN-674]|uniref:DUF8106 domain-containing protein n=1 Tax=Natronorubrum halalkaliphilum TaxID=2691917 RepID=A0A6B0VJV5_9EURY|nr:hypothetical protein [Natronorubrum halalkaliphilum]MXV61256.1 hypothetical protein [Natronorubrum halalkaliphilum]
MTPSTSGPSRPPSSKTVLYCFSCGHESPIDGDWNVRRAENCDSYRCPDCETTITDRPRSFPGHADNSSYCAGD